MADFQRPEGINPIISPDTTTFFYCPMRQDSVAWEASDTFNPAATVYNGKQQSSTGLKITRQPVSDHVPPVWDMPILTTDYTSNECPYLYFIRQTTARKSWKIPGGCEDPRVAVTEDGLYVMHYTQWNRKQARLAVATSRDLQTWEKHGPAFAKAYNGRFMDEFSKSASIVTQLIDGKQVIAKIDGKYWMYWGEKFCECSQLPQTLSTGNRCWMKMENS